MVLAIAFSESSLDYDVSHPTKDLHGIGGIKRKLHKTKNDPNSLMGIEEVFLGYLHNAKGNRSKALKDYKGTVKNFKSYNITIKLYNRLNRLQNQLLSDSKSGS